MRIQCKINNKTLPYQKILLFPPSLLIRTMRGDDEHQATMFGYISEDQCVPTDHPLRPIRNMPDEALRQQDS